jgi:hypothetical protein
LADQPQASALTSPQRTANALRQFQRDQGLMATGRLDGETMNALGR